MKDTEHPARHPRVHLADRASARRRRGCEIWARSPLYIRGRGSKNNEWALYWSCVSPFGWRYSQETMIDGADSKGQAITHDELPRVR